MTDIRAGDLRISGGIRAGNWKFGNVSITPVANTPTSTTVSGLSLKGAGTIVGLCTPVTTLPGSEVWEACVNSVASTGMTIWLYRTNTSVTYVNWMMWRNRV